MLTFQDLILKLQSYWGGKGCALLQPYDMEVGAGTFHTATFLRAIGPEELESRGVGAVADELLDRFSGLSHVYLSIDIDALDPAYAPGTGIPDAGGLSPRQVITLIRRLDALPFVGADLVEVAPPLDSGEITSFAALKIIMEIFGLVLRRKRQGLSTHLNGAGR